MLTAFIRAQDLDVILLQEVVTPDSIDVPGYSVYSNVGTNLRGTAIMARRNTHITHIEKLPSGRAMAVTCHGFRIINIYAPSGTAKKTERELFYNVELPVLLAPQRLPLLVGGDFNCILSPLDSTGTYTASNALSNIVHGLRLKDTWNQEPARPVYTHYSPLGATRIDRFYISQDVLVRKTGIHIVPTAFTDHQAVVLRLQIPTGDRRPRTGRWKMNPDLIKGTPFTDAIKVEWEKWKRSKGFYTDTGSWWERQVKPNIRRLARRVETEKHRMHKLMENHLYECLYDIIQANIPEAEKYSHLQKYKAKIVRLNARKREHLLLDTHPYDRLDDENPSLYQILKIKKRQAAREIRRIIDVDGTVHTTQKGIADTFVQHYARTFRQIATDRNAIQILMQNMPQKDPQLYKDRLEQPITSDEVHRAIKAGAKKKTPGIDGMCLEFYVAHWTLIGTDLTQVLNDMFLHKRITMQQKQGIIICLPKASHGDTPHQYRPISLLTTEYKLLARIMAHRLQVILEDQALTGQYCGMPHRTILDALATVRDLIAYHETEKIPLCIVTLDFQQAFDRIAHEYLFTILECYGVGKWFIDRIRVLYENMNALVQINGALAGPIKIQSGIRQGCPLSMCLYAMCMQPLIRLLEVSLSKLRIGRTSIPTPVVAYADDITIFVKDPAGFKAIHEALQIYEQASGASLNQQKSAVMSVAGWSDPPSPLNIPCHDRIVILGVAFRPTIALSRDDNWTQTIQAVRVRARQSFPRTLCLQQRIQYVTICLLAKIWFLAQNFLMRTTHARQLTSVCQWFIWQAAIFRVPVTTLQRSTVAGGWGLPNIEVKCRSLLYNRLRITAAKQDSILAKIFQTWGLWSQIQNPPPMTIRLTKMDYLMNFILDAAYMTLPVPHGSNGLKKEIYSSLLAVAKNKTPESEMRIMRKYPTIAWDRVWKNLHTTGLAPPIKSLWYAAIQDILPTNDRLASINLAPETTCPRCHMEDSVRHRIVECEDGPRQWTWTRQKLAFILRTEAKHIPTQWVIAPDMNLWPPQRRMAVIWILAHFVFYRLQNNRRLSLQDYTDFMKRARWKQQTNEIRPNTGRYLEVLEWKFS